MSDWASDYARKVVSAEEAVRCVRSDDRVVCGNLAGEARLLAAALVARAAELRGVKIVHMTATGPTEYCKPGYEGVFHHESLFVGPGSREAVAAGRAEYIPTFFFEEPRLFTDGTLPLDVAFVHLSPPDKHGFCSFGTSVDYTKTATEAATTVVAQVNARMPRTHGDSFIHASQLDFVVECDDDLLEVTPRAIGPVEEAIGRNVATLIDDGDTLQLGYGAIPDALLHFLADKEDLGIHSETFSDGAVELVEAGVITNRRKSLHRGRMVANFLLGTRRVYDFADDNPMVNLFPVEYTNDPFVIGQIDHFVSLNTAMEVDLLGQVMAETIGPLQYSGIGGQVDFIRGAARSKGGRSVIALPATARDGTVSRIVAVPAPGSVVTTGRTELDYVVTEYGVAHLRGKGLRARAEALIAIAHPDFRAGIEEDCAAVWGRAWLRG